MHEFRYIGGQLFCEDTPVIDIASKYGTPVYVYSHKTLVDHYRKLKDAFGEISPLICFSMKANSNLSICRALVKEGAGLDVVSGGELFKALKAGARPKKIVYASVGKTPKEIENAIKSGILFFNVESLPELRFINDVSRKLRKRTDICIRVNPDIDPHTHKFIKTGRAQDKFGLDFQTAKGIFQRPKLFPHTRIIGLHVHIGSQITQSQPFVRAIKRVGAFVEELRRSAVKLEYLNIGGGLGIVYKGERAQTAAEFARVILPLLKKIDLKVILEPGRFIVGNAGILVAKVIYIKKTKSKNFVIVDAGMNDLLRPVLYGAYHEISPVSGYKGHAAKGLVTADIVGPICESSDFLGKNRKLPELAPGDYLAVMGAGAYGYSMSSNYNARPRAAEILVKGGKFYLIKQRERYEDLIKGEKIPAFLR